MSITKKYDYKSLRKENLDGSRKYLTPDGMYLPSVTTILDATKSEESKQALHNWRKRVGVDKAASITLESSSRGTRMHKWLENYIKTDNIGEPGSNPYSQQSHAMAKEIISKGLINCQEFWGTEVSLYFPEVYAGTTDLAGLHNNSEAICDHKQTNKLKKREWIDDYFVQLTAYANAHNEIYNTRIRKGVIFMCVKPEEIRPGVWAEPKYQEFILEGNEFDKYSDMWWVRVENYYKKFL
jgi:genome maintenance exonuclease 1